MKREAKNVPFFSRFIGVLVIVEAVAFGTSYYFWRSMNQSREERLHMKSKAPWALELFYKIGETANSQDKTREHDAMEWARLEKLK